MIHKKGRFVELDAFRGLAAIMVLYFHYTSQYRIYYGHNFSSQFDFGLGKHGVSFFFIISGFVIYLTVEKVENVKQFLIRRFSRLYPVYWFCLLVSFVLVSLYGLQGKETTLKEAFIGLTMIQDLLNVRHVDESYWSLLPELQFYGFMAVLILINQRKYIIHWAVLWVVVTTLISVSTISGVSGFYKFRYNVLFLTGMLFYQIWKGNKKMIIHFLIFLCFLLWSFLIKNTGVIILSGTFFMLFYVVCFAEVGFLKNPVFTFLGRISYPLYLLHQFIGYIIMNNIKPYFGNNIWLMVGVPGVIVISLAWVVSKYIEYPSIKMTRSLFRRVY